MNNRYITYRYAATAALHNPQPGFSTGRTFVKDQDAQITSLSYPKRESPPVPLGPGAFFFLEENSMNTLFQFLSGPNSHLLIGASIPVIIALLLLWIAPTIHRYQPASSKAHQTKNAASMQSQGYLSEL